MKAKWFLLGAASLGLAAAAPLEAQSSDGWWDPVVVGARDGGDRPSIRDVILGRSGRDAPDARSSRWPGDDRYEDRGRAAKKGNGPPFCRNGQGHPVHGRRWCEEKGWGNGNRYDYGDWRAADWRDVIFRDGPTRQQRMGSPSIADILGDAVLGRLSGHGRAQGLRGAVDGRWLPLARGGSILQLRMGGVPLAEVADLDRDGRAEMVLLRGR